MRTRYKDIQNTDCAQTEDYVQNADLELRLLFINLCVTQSLIRGNLRLLFSSSKIQHAVTCHLPNYQVFSAVIIRIGDYSRSHSLFNPFTPKAFVPLLTSSSFTQKGVIYSEIVEHNKTFPTIPNPARKTQSKISLSTLCLFMVSIYCLFKTFSEILLPVRSLVEGQKLQQKETNTEKGKAKK